MRFLSTATALASLGAALPSASQTSVHEKRIGEPIAWVRQDRASKDLVLPVRIGLKQANLENMYKFVDDVANPKSANFGKHWTPEQIAKTFAPDEASIKETIAWLVSSGISASRIKRSAGDNWLEFDSTVAEAEKLFHTEYYNFQQRGSTGSRVASDEYSLPNSVREHVDFIMPTIQLDGLKPVPRKHLEVLKDVPLNITGLTNSTVNCDRLITIDCLRALYGIPIPDDRTADKSNVMGIAEWADYLYNPDLDIFFANYTNPVIPKGFYPEFISIDGGKPGTYDRVKSQNNVESALDFMSAYSIIYPQNTRLYQVGDGVNVDSVGTFNIFLDALDGSYCTYKGGDQPYIDPAYPDPNDGGYTGPHQCGGAPISNVISVSYGQIEASLPRFYQERQCYEWAKLGLQGVSVIFASGDSGVANRYNSGYPDTCLDEDEKFVDEHGRRFSPSFPVNCPYITAVGATTLLTKDVKDGERAVARFGSGGGFSDIFTAPDYQLDVTRNYVSKYAPAAYGPKIYNHTGRGYPDVAASGDRLATVSDGQIYGIGGTSASAPVFAAIINVLNEKRLKMGKKPIGFLNPSLYAHPEMFNDITVGSNPGCGTDGFPASKGWDPVTGLGTPNFKKMCKVLVKQLP